MCLLFTLFGIVKSFVIILLLSHHQVLDVKRTSNLTFYFIDFWIMNKNIKGFTLNLIIDFVVLDFEVGIS